MTRPFFMLLVLDGFGCRKEAEWNAIAQAKTPRFDRLYKEASWTTLEASGLRVGLPEGQMGNSEVGHLNLGAGRVVDQDIVRITKSIVTGEMKSLPTLVSAADKAKRDGTAIHLVGLLSEGGVHSLQSQLEGLIDALIANGVGVRSDGSPTIYVHAILDGRDTPPSSAADDVRQLVEFLESRPQAAISTIVGRYYTMDRDKRWERVKRGYELMTLGIGTETRNPVESVKRFYESAVTDEFMEPIAVLDASGAHRGKVGDGDTIIFFNFRSDRMRQIVTSLYDPAFSGFEREVVPKVDLISMTRYSEDFKFPVLFPKVEVRNYIGRVFAREKLRQLRIAETEKFAHVTFFFNGGSDEVSPGEERVLIPSPKVATYDLQPEMSLHELRERVVSEIDSGKYDVVIMNIANPDMVGHSGIMPATIHAVEETDVAVSQILDAVARRGGTALITSDHGNSEMLYDPATGQPHTAHTLFPVPLILFEANGRSASLRRGGALENVAPTVLDILGIAKPEEMTAESLLVRS